MTYEGRRAPSTASVGAMPQEKAEVSPVLKLSISEGEAYLSEARVGGSRSEP